MERRSLPIVCLFFLVVLSAGCGPEADRTRGGGAGADIGNYPDPRQNVQLHGDVSGPPQIYFNTPKRIVPEGIGEPVK